MKKLILIIAIFITTITYAQKPKVDAVRYKELTTTQRDALTVPSGEHWKIYNITTTQFEYWDGDSWEAIVGGGGSGDVTKVGTPVDNQIAVWTGDGTVEGTTWLSTSADADTNNLSIGFSDVIQGGVNLNGNASIGGGFINFFNSASNDTNTDLYVAIADTDFKIYKQGQPASLQIDAITAGVSSPATSIADITTLGAKALITKEYADANYSGGGSTTFSALTDTPSSYTGNAGKFTKVNAGETALEYTGDVMQYYASSQYKPIEWIGDQATHDAVFGVGYVHPMTDKVTIIDAPAPLLEGTDISSTAVTAGYVLQADGDGTSSWVAPSGGGLSNIVEDTTPQLGGKLDVNGFYLVSGTGTNGITVRGGSFNDVYVNQANGFVSNNYLRIINNNNIANYGSFVGTSISGAALTWTVPATSGTLALTSDIPTNADYVDLTTAQSIAGIKTFSSGVNFNNSASIVETGGDLIFTPSISDDFLFSGNITASQVIVGSNLSGTNTGDDPFTATKISGASANAGLTGTEEVLINNAGTLEKTTTQDIADLGSGGAIDWQGAWISGNYVVDQVVSYLGSSYICKLNTVSNEIPTNATYWDLMAQKGDTGATGATGAAGFDTVNGIIKVATIYLNDPELNVVDINLITKTVTFTQYKYEFVLNSFNRVRYDSATVTLDFSTFNTADYWFNYIYYDNSDNSIRIGQRSGVSTFGSVFDPTNANHWLLTSWKNYNSGNNIKLTHNQHAFNLIHNTGTDHIEKLTILGDSHTLGGDLWISEMKRNHGNIGITLKLGYNGSTIGDISTYSYYDRRTSITTDTDLLLIYGGTNDFDNSVVVGTVQDGGTYTLTTTVGSLQTIIEYAYTLNPAMQIILITPQHHFTAYPSGGVQNDVSAYSDGIKAVGTYYNIPVLDLNDVLQINKYNYATYMADAVHLNNTGKTKVGRVVSEFIKNNY